MSVAQLRCRAPTLRPWKSKRSIITSRSDPTFLPSSTHLQSTLDLHSSRAKRHGNSAPIDWTWCGSALGLDAFATLTIFYCMHVL